MRHGSLLYIFDGTILITKLYNDHDEKTTLFLYAFANGSGMPYSILQNKSPMPSKSMGDFYDCINSL